MTRSILPVSVKRYIPAQSKLEAAGIEEPVLKVGDRAPGFRLFILDHVQVVSNDLLDQGL
jgi:hypothetical protein